MGNVQGTVATAEPMIDWIEDPDSDDDESYPPHLNETEESEA